MGQIGAWIEIDCVRFVANWKVFFEIRGFSVPDRIFRQRDDPLVVSRHAFVHPVTSVGLVRAHRK